MNISMRELYQILKKQRGQKTESLFLSLLHKGKFPEHQPTLMAIPRLQDLPGPNNKKINENFIFPKQQLLAKFTYLIASHTFVASVTLSVAETTVFTVAFLLLLYALLVFFFKASRTVGVASFFLRERLDWPWVRSQPFVLREMGNTSSVKSSFTGLYAKLAVET